ncbi:unnamed protein product, partial [Prorocentrum cordatum]
PQVLRDPVAPPATPPWLSVCSALDCPPTRASATAVSTAAAVAPTPLPRPSDASEQAAPEAAAGAPDGAPLERPPGRFTARRRPRDGWEDAPSGLANPPGRLLGAVAAGGGDPLCFGGAREDPALNFESLIAFQHLAALEEAVSSGAALDGRLPLLPQRPAPGPRGGRGRALAPAESPLSARGAAIVASAVSEKARQAGLRKQLAGAPGAALQRDPGCSILRGAAPPQRGRGPLATARWLGAEGARLQERAREPQGGCRWAAFLHRGGHAELDDLRAPLCVDGLVP